MDAIKNAWRWMAGNWAPLSLTGGSALLVALFLFLFYHPPQGMIGPEQPIPFSHRLHVGVKAIQCQFCHPYVGQSNHPGLPPVEKCLYCHNYIITKHWWIQKEHEYFNTKTPTPWVKANYLAEHVLFNHERHIRFGLQCESCHGKVETQDRIKGTHFYMGFCIDCHTREKVNLDCWLACHS
ncbi:MAG: cytochrome c3 family protein [Desulfobacterales bacterium]